MTITTEVDGSTPVLLYNDECGVCRHVAAWVATMALTPTGPPPIDERPIGDDPVELRALNENLDIWDAYETIHLLMPDGTMKTGGEACAEVLRRLPRTRWLAGSLGLRIGGHRPFQSLLNFGYLALSDVRPVFGCESCGTPSPWLRPFVWVRTRTVAIGKERSAARRQPIH